MILHACASFNTSSKFYHCLGACRYGTTKQGSYMSEAVAKAAGDYPDHERPVHPPDRVRHSVGFRVRPLHHLCMKTPNGPAVDGDGATEHAAA